MSRLRITVVVDDVAVRPDALAEHGLSLWVEYGGAQILFDTGQGKALFHNALLLGRSLRDIGSVCISHGHYDHLGGLAVTLAQAPAPNLYLHPAALRPKYGRRPDGTVRSIGVAPDALPLISNAVSAIAVENPTEVFGGFFLTGPIPRVTDFEDTGGPFFLDPTGHSPDPLVDDLAAYVDTPEGLVILLGCAHAGIINTLTYIRQLAPRRPIHTIIGGTHLISASAHRMEATVTALRQFSPKRLMPLHCTGPMATARLRHAFPDEVLAGGAGAVLEIAA